MNNDVNTNRININLDSNILIEEASNFVNNHKDFIIEKINNIGGGGIVKTISGIVNRSDVKYPIKVIYF